MPGVCVKPAVGAVDHHVVCDEFAKVLESMGVATRVVAPVEGGELILGHSREDG
jgi:hypothetical protein